MSKPAVAPTTASGRGVPPPVGEPCPLCGGPLHPGQDWCLRCGAAARTRLAATPNWRVPIAVVVAVIVLALGVLAAALVDLAGSSSPTKIRVTGTVTTTASVTSPGTATPAPSATTPAAAVPSASTLAAAASVRLTPVTTLTSSIVNLNGTVNPHGVATTYEFQYGATTSYGGRAPGTPVAVGAGTSAVAVSARVTYLAPGTRYHYKLTASKAGRAFSTADATFTTLPAPSPQGAGSTTPGKPEASGPAP
jgi:hypothetical protein